MMGTAFELAEDSMLDWFDLYVEIDEAFLRSGCDSDGCREHLMLCCKGSDLNELLIGKDHIFNPLDKWSAKGRTECDFKICVRRSSRLSEKAIESMGLGGESVGEVQFWKDQNLLEAEICVEDDLAPAKRIP